MRFLICGDDCKPSTAKIWRHIAFGIITYKIAMMEILSYDLIAVYLGAVAGVEIGQKFTPAAKARLNMQQYNSQQGYSMQGGDNDQQQENIRFTSKGSDTR